MGVLNATPDSFSDGGQFLDPRAAQRHAEHLLACGAAVIDVGAESTRPGAPAVSAEEQLARIGDLVKALSKSGALVSIDTTSELVAKHALDDGAVLVNSVDPASSDALARVARPFGAMLALMHSRGSMTPMAGFSRADENAYDDVVEDVARVLGRARDAALEAGLSRGDILLDPGLGFHKSARHSLTLLAHLDRLSALGHELLVGPSRKSFVASVTTAPGKPVPAPSERLGGTIAACLIAADRGAAMLRVHDPFEVGQALSLHRAARHA
jgi:dihydropteroate synthase